MLTTPRTSRPLRRGHRAGTVLAVAVTLGVLTGCSGGADTPGASDATGMETSSSAPPSSTGAAPTSGGAETTSPASSTLQPALVDFAIEMPETELAAGTYTLEVANEGGASHDLVIEGPDGEDVAATEILAPGTSGSLEVTLEPGEYSFYCSVGTHRAMGMELVVTVV